MRIALIGTVLILGAIGILAAFSDGPDRSCEVTVLTENPGAEVRYLKCCDVGRIEFRAMPNPTPTKLSIERAGYSFKVFRNGKLTGELNNVDYTRPNLAITILEKDI